MTRAKAFWLAIHGHCTGLISPRNSNSIQRWGVAEEEEENNDSTQNNNVELKQKKDVIVCSSKTGSWEQD